MYSLSGKKALITGGTSGIGLAVARSFVAAGAEVIVTGRREDGQSIAAAFGAHFLRIDAADETAVAAGFAVAAAQLGPLDVLVINAGAAADEGSLESFDSAQARELIELNLGGAFLALKHAPAHLADGASIIATGSVAGSGITHAGSGVYAASKAGVAYLCRTAALELANRGIRVNVVCPALIAGTGMMTADDGGPEARFLATLTAFGRMGRQEEVIGIYNFLAGEGSTFITGQEIRVDGGMSAGFGNPLMRAVSAQGG